MTGKSFEEIQYELVGFRKHRYLEKRIDYEISRDIYCKTQGIPLESTASFSAMDDETGYNDPVNTPSEKYVIEIMEDYVNANESFLTSSFEDLPPFPVISADHTFNISKRTKQYVPPVEPEF